MRKQRVWVGKVVFKAVNDRTETLTRVCWLPDQHSFIKKMYVCLCLDSFFYGEGDGTPLQYSCLENPMDGGAW